MSMPRVEQINANTFSMVEDVHLDAANYYVHNGAPCVSVPGLLSVPVIPASSQESTDNDILGLPRHPQSCQF